jgi:hypothetical protein
LELILYAGEVKDGQSLNQKRLVAEELHCGVNFSDYGFGGRETIRVFCTGKI